MSTITTPLSTDQDQMDFMQFKGEALLDCFHLNMYIFNLLELNIKDFIATFILGYQMGN